MKLLEGSSGDLQEIQLVVLQVKVLYLRKVFECSHVDGIV
jgi:hypothetical protein